MARYIDADKLIELMKKEDALVEDDDIEEYAKMYAEDVAPVVHGKWTDTNNPNHKRCSNCDVISFIALYPRINKADYCPHCGSKMDE